VAPPRRRGEDVGHRRADGDPAGTANGGTVAKKKKEEKKGKKKKQ